MPYPDEDLPSVDQLAGGSCSYYGQPIADVPGEIELADSLDQPLHDARCGAS